MWAKQKQPITGFTIVELLIVIVIIGILAAITIVAYNGITTKAKIATITSDLDNAVKTLEMDKVSNNDQYPSTLAAANLKSSSGNTLSYTYNSNSNTYCVSITNGSLVYSTSGEPAVSGDCTSAGLVGWWPLNGNANDALGRNNGTVNNATLTSGQNGSSNDAYSFNGTNSNISLADIDVPSTITVSAWVLPSNSTQYSKVLAKHTGAGDVQGTIGDDNGYASFEITTNGTYYLLSAPSLLSTTSWSNIVGVYDGTSDMLYVNGVMVRNIAASGPIATNAQLWTIGSMPNGTNNFFSGSIDDARIYNRALSPSEVALLYSNGAK